MERQELELLCSPLSPEEVLEEMSNICNEYAGKFGVPIEFITLKASRDILSRLIESFDESPSVRAARIMF